MKIAINKCHGGFGLSDAASAEYKNRGGVGKYDWEIRRDCPILISVIEDMGSSADGRYASIEIVEIPDDVEWEIAEYDGLEWVAEKHRTWG